MCLLLFKKTKIYRLPQYPNSPSIPGPTTNENKSLLLTSGNGRVMNRIFEFMLKMLNEFLDEDNISTISANRMSSNEDLDEVEDKMPEISAKKVCACRLFFLYAQLE